MSLFTSLYFSPFLQSYFSLPLELLLQRSFRQKYLNELYRLTSCKNFLKESLGTQPRRPPKEGAKDFTGY
jgi:hypothetical protein